MLRLIPNGMDFPYPTKKETFAAEIPVLPVQLFQLKSISTVMYTRPVGPPLSTALIVYFTLNGIQSMLASYVRPGIS